MPDLDRLRMYTDVEMMGWIEDIANNLNKLIDKVEILENQKENVKLS